MRVGDKPSLALSRVSSTLAPGSLGLCLLWGCGTACLPWLAACSAHLSQKKPLLAAWLALLACPAWGRGVRGSQWADLRAQSLGSPGSLEIGWGAAWPVWASRSSQIPSLSCCHCFCPGQAQTLRPFPSLQFFPVVCASLPALSFSQKASWLWVLS